MPKKNNPGCNCCEGEVCDKDCWYGCQNGSPPCPHPCAIKITMPQPDDVPTADGPTCAPQECNITAPCYTCLRWFDYNFSLQNFGGSTEGDCQDFTIRMVGPTLAQDELFESVNCWTPGSYNCPYDSPVLDFCGPKYAIFYPQVIWNVKREDGCAITTITLEYTVTELCNDLFVMGVGIIAPQTKYQHRFIKTHCDCDEVLGAVPFDSTISENNERGITVPDVCNADSATLELIDDCLTCSCFDCGDEILLSVSGPVFNGTIVLEFQGSQTIGAVTCGFSGKITGTCPEVGESSMTVSVTVECSKCNTFNLRLFAAITRQPIGEICEGYSLNHVCGDSVTFTLENCSGTPFCGIESHEFSVSSL
jgi:hypothetical protein